MNPPTPESLEYKVIAGVVTVSGMVCIIYSLLRRSWILWAAWSLVALGVFAWLAGGQWKAILVFGLVFVVARQLASMVVPESTSGFWYRWGLIGNYSIPFAFVLFMLIFLLIMLSEGFRKWMGF